MVNLTKSTENPDHICESSDLIKRNMYYVSLADIIIILWRKRLILVLFLFISILAGICYALMTKDVFSTKTLFIVKSHNSSNNTNLNQLALLAGISMSTGDNLDPSDYFDKVIKDRLFLSSLFKRKWICQGESLSMENILRIEPDSTTINWKYRYVTLKMEKIRQGNYIKIVKDKANNILTLTVDMPDPQLAYDVNIYTIDYLKTYLRKFAKSQAKEKRLFVEARLKETSAELTVNENALTKFREHNVINKAPSAQLEEERLFRQVTFSQEIYLQLKKQYELARIEELNDQTLIEVLLNPEVPLFRDKPNRRLIIVISCILGGFVGIIAVLSLEMIPLLISTLKNQEEK